MYIGSQNLLKGYDQCLLDHGYTIQELIDKASDCLFAHFVNYDSIGLFIGPGNNGADGLSLAVKLTDAGKNVTVYYIGDPDKFSEGNKSYFDLCEDREIMMIHLDDEEINTLKEDINNYEVIGDAFFGFGLNSSPRGLYKECINVINKYFDKDVIAIDIPTGLNCNTGKPYECVVYATKTVSLTAYKEGFLNPDSRVFTGEVVVETLDALDVSREAGLYEMIEYGFVKDHIKSRKFDGYKNLYGVDLMITGSKEYKGASLLSAKACVYAGAGIVKVMSVPEVTNILPLYVPEAIGIQRPELLKRKDLENYNAILLGSGLGLGLHSEHIMTDVLRYSHAPLVIDADGLTLLSGNMELLNDQNRPIILTPHIGEFNRLCPHNKDEDLMEVAARFAADYHVILILKGPYSIVTDGLRRYRIHSGNPAMSVAGMGDVLAGIVTAFIGQGYPPVLAAVLAVYLHGYTGDLIGAHAYSVIPDRLIELLPEAMFHLNKKS